MEKITTANWDDVHDMRGSAVAFCQLGVVDEGNFWHIREKARMVNGTYTPINIPGDDPMRFLHQSLDDPDKVSYTKSEDKGREDLQTRTTLLEYCEKFGLEVPTTVPNCGILTVDYKMIYLDLECAVRAYFDSKVETTRLKKIVQEMI